MRYMEKYCRAARPQLAIWRKRNACWTAKAKHTYTHTQNL